MVNLIPPIGTRGRYSVKTPFTTSLERMYQCTAIRKFVDLEAQGHPVYKTYYESVGISQSIYERDRQNNVVILTLSSDDRPPIYLPSSFLKSYPDIGAKQYHQVVLGVSLGPIPDDIDLSHLQQQLAAVASDVIGVEPDVHVAVSPIKEAVSSEDHETFQTNRASRIQNRETDYARVLELQQQNQRLQVTINNCMTLLKNNGIVPE